MTSDGHLIRIELPSSFDLLDLVQLLSDRIAGLAGLDEDTTHWVSVAVRESVINAIKHGNHEDRKKHVTVEFMLSPRARPEEFVVQVLDEGAGFDPEAIANPLEPENVLKSSGRGIFFMRSFMDDVSIAPAAGRRDGRAHEQEARLIGPRSPLHRNGDRRRARRGPHSTPVLPAQSRRSKRKGRSTWSPKPTSRPSVTSARSSRAAFRHTSCWARKRRGGAEEATARCRWIIDPVDGTTNFAHGLALFCVSIALEIDGELQIGVVYDPMAEELFTAERGQGARLNGLPLRVSPHSELVNSLLCTGFPYSVREHPRRQVEVFRAFLGSARAVRRLGSAALDLCYVAAGRFEGFWEEQLHAWDMAAGVLIVHEAGGLVTRYDTSPIDLFGGQIVATNGHVHEAMLGVIRAVHHEGQPEAGL